MKEYSVLVVDDSEADRYILKRYFKKAGLTGEILEAEDGQVALEIFRDYEASRKSHGDKFPPLIVFLDINMPRVDGFQFLEEFKSIRADQSEYAASVLLMFSSSENENDKSKALGYEFVKDYFVKGELNADTLKTKVDSILAMYD